MGVTGRDTGWPPILVTPYYKLSNIIENNMPITGLNLHSNNLCCVAFVHNTS